MATYSEPISRRGILDAVRSRFVSRQGILFAFAACLFPIHVWSIITLLKEVPALIIHLSTWDLLGFIAYTQAFALFESLIVLIPLVILGTLLPARFYRSKFVAVSTLIVFVTSAWFILAHLNDKVIREWGPREFLPWAVVYLLSLAIAYLIVYRSARLETAITSFVQRLAVLSFVYFVFDLASIAILMLRNI